MNSGYDSEARAARRERTLAGGAWWRWGGAVGDRQMPQKPPQPPSAQREPLKARRTIQAPDTRFLSHPGF